jgi:glycosyltransferase involved in cell wall biosynthesis
MRFCLISNSISLWSGGHSRNFRLLSEALARRGHDVTLVTASFGEEKLAPAGCQLVSLHAKIKPKFLGFALAVDRWLGKRSAEFDLVHVNGAYELPYALRRGLRSRLVRHLRGTYWTILRAAYRDEYFSRRSFYMRKLGGAAIGQALDRLSLPACDHILANSPETRRDTLRKVPIAPHRISVLPNGIEFPFLPPDHQRSSEVRRDFGFLEDDFIISCLASMYAGKGWSYLCRIAGALHRQGVRFKLLLLGDGYFRSRVEAEIARYGLAQQTIFAGAIRNDAKKVTLLQASDLFLYPSSPGTTVLEALALGVPVVNAIRPRDCSAGMDWDPLSALGVGKVLYGLAPEEVAAALRPIIRSRDGLGSEAGREYCRRELNWDRVAEKAEVIYTSILNQANRVPGERR